MRPPPPAKRQRRNALRPGSAEIASLREVGALYGLERFGVSGEYNNERTMIDRGAGPSEDPVQESEEDSSSEEAESVNEASAAEEQNEPEVATKPVNEEEEKPEDHEEEKK